MSSVEKKLTSGGPDAKRLNMKQFIKLADAEKIEADVDEMIFRTLKEKFRKDKKAGESFSDYLKRTPREELIRLDLENGGRVIDITKYLKVKEPKNVKKISLSDFFDTSRTVESLSPTERDSLRFLLRKIF